MATVLSLLFLLACDMFNEPEKPPLPDPDKPGRSNKPYPDTLANIYLRAYKQEELLELWIQKKSDEKYELYHTYVVQKASGRLGPKRKEGDGQVPEGFYVVDRFNPKSQYHLSLGLDYPNASDKKRSDPTHPGSDIFIHGSNVSIGCLAMGNDAIEEIYDIAETAKKSGKPIRVDIYPFKMTKENLDSAPEKARQHLAFWTDELLPGYEWFEKHRTPAKFKVEPTGNYVVVP